MSLLQNHRVRYAVGVAALILTWGLYEYTWAPPPGPPPGIASAGQSINCRKLK
ncbi:hypothetical protein C8R43DRAFT_1143649 [Mycena crocata]|nr:hypothetical protein C8R43DRAFT_1143649 [Mycena crocata]